MLGSENHNYNLIVFTAPSGAGKTTIVRHLLEVFPDVLGFSTSATTRERRENEVEGEDYYFMTEETFKSKIDDGDFVEWEEVYQGSYYGTLYSEIERLKAAGKVIIFDIDVHGAESIKDKYGDECLVVFVKPPSFRTLIQRLTDRQTESAESFERRVNRIKKELLYENSFDLVLLNDKLDIALSDAESIIKEKVLSSDNRD